MQCLSKRVFLLLLLPRLLFALKVNPPHSSQSGDSNEVKPRPTLEVELGTFKKVWWGGKFVGQKSDCPVTASTSNTFNDLVIESSCDHQKTVNRFNDLVTESSSCDPQKTVQVVANGKDRWKLSTSSNQGSAVITLCAGKGVEVYKKKGGIIFYDPKTKQAMKIGKLVHPQLDWRYISAFFDTDVWARKEKLNLLWKELSAAQRLRVIQNFKQVELTIEYHRAELKGERALLYLRIPVKFDEEFVFHVSPERIKWLEKTEDPTIYQGATQWKYSFGHTGRNIAWMIVFDKTMTGVTISEIQVLKYVFND